MNRGNPPVKCNFCPHSIMKHGKLHCPYSNCLLFREDIEEILDKLTRRENNG